MGPSPTRHELFLRRKEWVAFLEDRYALVRSSSIPVDKTIDAAHKELNCVRLVLGIWSLLCVCVGHIIVCASHRITHTCMWKERTSLDGWIQDVCKSSGGDTQRSKHNNNNRWRQTHNNHKCWNFPLWIIVGLPSMPPWLITACTSKKKTRCVEASHSKCVSVCECVTVVCDSDEADKARKWLRSEEGEKQSQTGSSRFTDVDPRVSKGAYFGSNFPNETIVGGFGKLPTAAILGNPQQPFGGPSAAATVWFMHFYTCTRQVAQSW